MRGSGAGGTSWGFSRCAVGRDWARDKLHRTTYEVSNDEHQFTKDSCVIHTFFKGTVPAFT